MEVTRYYPIKKRGISRLDCARVVSLDGSSFYVSQRIYNHVEKEPGISYLELIMSIYADIGMVVLPFNPSVNNLYNRFRSLICRIKQTGYIEGVRERASPKQEDLHSTLYCICRGIKLKVEIPKCIEFKGKQIPINVLSFDEMLDNASLSICMVAPLLTSPRTMTYLSDATGTRKHNITDVLTGFNYLGLLDRKENRYFLTNSPDKRHDLIKLLERCQIGKEKYADKLRRIIKAMEMIENGDNYSDISMITGFHCSTLHDMKFYGLNLRPKRIELLSSQGLLNTDEVEKLESLGLLL